MNLYAYVHNDPMNLIDPTGESSYNPRSLMLTPEQNRALRGATKVSFGASLGLRIGVKTPNAKATLGAEASMIVQNGNSGAENVTTIEAGANIESGVVDVKAQLFKIEETTNSSSGVTETTSLIKEGPKGSVQIKSEAASISNDNKVKLEATVGVIKLGVEINLDKLNGN